MARTPQDITDAELAVLEVLWDEGPSTIFAVSRKCSIPREGRPKAFTGLSP